MNSLTPIQKWFTVTIAVLVALVTLYIVMHLYIPGAEVIRLSKQEITDMNLILFGNNTPSGAAGTQAQTPKTPGNPPQQAQRDTNQTAGATPQKPAPPDSIRRKSLYSYIFSVRPPYNDDDRKRFMEYFDSYSLDQIAAVLPNYPIRVKSYFWLTEGRRQHAKEGLKDVSTTIEGSVYLEIVFWTLFGLIANLLYRVSESIRTQGFKQEEISVHIAKFFYAPLCAIVIFFSFNVLVSEGDIAVAEFTHATIVLAFILGFFSGRTVELLERIKDLLLPLNRRQEEAAAAQSGAGSFEVGQQMGLMQEAIEKHFAEWQVSYPGLKGVSVGKQTEIVDGKSQETAQFALLFQMEQQEEGLALPVQLPKSIAYKGRQFPVEGVLIKASKAGSGPGSASTPASTPAK